MLIPREKPYLEGLNSYYLHLEKFIEHMQGDIGSGCLYCKSPSLEMLIFFTENEIVSSLVQEKGGQATVSPFSEIVKVSFNQANYSVKVYQLEEHALFFWAHMPSFQRAKSVLKSTEIPLPDLVFRLKQKQFSGFIDAKIVNKTESGVLFIHEGKRIGGSYTWGKGGMSTADEDYNILLSRMQSNEGIFTFGNFIKKN
jgi:hypothetical protein